MNILPQLIGSPKQIAWAEKIRAKLVRDNVGNDTPSLATCLSITKASFWIETRNMNWVQMGIVAAGIADGYCLAESVEVARSL
jgi:hypothetical protein